MRMVCWLYLLSQRAWLASVCCASGDRSVLSVEKYTRSPALTTKSRGEPGGAYSLLLLARSVSGRGLLAQADSASASATAVPTAAARLRQLVNSMASRPLPTRPAGSGNGV